MENGEKNAFNNADGVVACIYHNLQVWFHTYLQCHSKVFVVRADVRYPVNYPPVYNNLHI